MNTWKALAIVSTTSLMAIATFGSVRDASAQASGQPNMDAARVQLKAARASLDKAEHDKGGWRAAAIKATDSAIAEVDRGIAFGAK